MPRKLHIDFVSDISCSWCAIGLSNLQQAVDRLEGDIDVEINFRPFELNPDMVPGGQNLIEHLKEKYGWDDDAVLEVFRHVQASGELAGVAFHFDEYSRVYNTFDAHRLLHWARLHGRQENLKKALFAANFEGSADLGDFELLANLAGSIGLRAEDALQILASGAFKNEVRADQSAWIDAGVTALPSMVFGKRFAVTGAQPTGALQLVIERALADHSEMVGEQRA